MDNSLNRKQLKTGKFWKSKETVLGAADPIPTNSFRALFFSLLSTIRGIKASFKAVPALFNGLASWNSSATAGSNRSFWASGILDNSWAINGDLGSETGPDRKWEGRDSVRVVAHSETMRSAGLQRLPLGLQQFGFYSRGRAYLLVPGQKRRSGKLLLPCPPMFSNYLCGILHTVSGRVTAISAKNGPR